MGAPGCTGSLSSDGNGATEPLPTTGTEPNGGVVTGGQCSEAGLLPARVRRLTRLEYRTSVRDLLGLEELPEVDLEVEPLIDGFRNNAAALSVSARFAEQLQRAALQLSAKGITQFERHSACYDASFADEACVRAFIDQFGARAFRRPLSAEESDAYLELYRAGTTDDNAVNGVRTVIAALLQSPHFLYRTEIGSAAAPPGSAVRLSGHELASALSYTLWGAPPDAALLAAAESGALTSKGEIEAQARRMLADSRAAETISTFARQWLALAEPDNLVRDPTKFPGFEQLKPDLYAEFDSLAREAFLGARTTFADVFSSNRSWLTPALGSHYGLSMPGGGAAAVSLSGSARVGLLTSGALIASWSRDEDTAPMTRGKQLLQRVLCQALPPPPPALEVPAVPQIEGATQRERFAVHAQNPGCAGCHTRLDAVAFALEQFDSVGRFRTEENGKPIDASGSIREAGDLDGSFVNAADLASRLAGSQYARACLARQYVRFAAGVAATEDNQCLLDSVTREAAERGDSPSELLVAVVTSDYFSLREVR
jgi:hypothetical protein